MAVNHEAKFQDELLTLLDAISETQSNLDDNREDDPDYEPDAAESFLDEHVRVESVTTFEEAMVLTRNAGLVVRLKDGSEYQVTIVMSKSPKNG